MEGIPLSSNQNQSKTLEELRRKTLDKAIAAYSFYLQAKGHALEGVLEDAPQALPSLLKLIENLEKFGKCKNFSTNDPEALQKCIDEYRFKEGIVGGIWRYTIWRRTPEEIEEFTKGLKILVNGGKPIIKDLYKLYLQFKTNPSTITEEFRDHRILEIIPEVWGIASLMIRYLEDPEGYGKKLSKYLGKKLLVAKYLSILKDVLSKIPSSILKYLKGHRKAEMEEVEIRKELERVIRNYNLYASSINNAREVVLHHKPEALPSLATLIEYLRRWDESNLLTNDPEILRGYADMYHFMANFLGSTLTWSVSKYKHPPEEIEGFKKGLENLANWGEHAIMGLYIIYKGVKEIKLEEILKDYQTISSYELRKAHVDARVHAGERIEYFLVNYFRNPEMYEDHMKSVVTLGSLAMKYVRK